MRNIWFTSVYRRPFIVYQSFESLTNLRVFWCIFFSSNGSKVNASFQTGFRHWGLVDVRGRGLLWELGNIWHTTYGSDKPFASMAIRFYRPRLSWNFARQAWWRSIIHPSIPVRIRKRHPRERKSSGINNAVHLYAIYRIDVCEFWGLIKEDERNGRSSW